MEYRELLDIAIDAYKNAYAPYSKVQVGAALLTKSGKVYTGVNVENASFGATNCAERTAVFKAVSEGEKEYVAIAVASNLEQIITPCGICRQVLIEFNPEMDVILGDKDNMNIYKLFEILPLGFKKDSFFEEGGEDEL